jgi:hypothetical protein
MQALLVAVLLLGAKPSLTTTAEQSGFTKTGRYDEVLALCRAFQEAYPALVKCTEFGVTPEGRSMVVLAISSDQKKDEPVILIQAGIHAGEIDGKDAGFWALRELLDRKDAAKIFSAFTLLFVPVYNVDGHERFGPNHRINQRGPVEMGWRTTAQNLNLNRDYAKADAPETRAMLALMRTWDPVAIMDLHVTDGADFQYDVAVLVEPSEVGSEALREPGKKLRSELLSALEKKKYLGLPFYPSLRKDDDPTSGFETGTAPARFALGYGAARNRLSILVETHSWKVYARRVRTTHALIHALVEAAVRDAGAWQRAARLADEEAKQLGGTDVPLAWGSDGTSHAIDFRGYEYARTPSLISGRLATTYDPKKARIWTVPLFDKLKPELTVTAPRGGYIVPVEHAVWMRERLRDHGIAFTVIDRAVPRRELEVFRATEVQLRKDTFEGRTTASVKGAWKKERADVAKGSLWIPIAQPLAKLILILLEPTNPDSYLGWGFFNVCFEQKEYMEAYVAEAVAKEMLAKDPALAREFAAKLDSDPDFAANPEKRLDFFYRRHPSWDDRVNRYPIMRSDAAL